MKTTYNIIKSHKPCKEGWVKLLAYYNPSDMDSGITISEILISNGIKDAVWALRCVEDKKPVYLFSADVAESVLYIFEKKHPTDTRPRLAIEAIRKYARKEVPFRFLKDAAYAAVDVDAAVDAAAYAAAYAAAAYAAVDAAVDAAYAAVDAAYAAADAAVDAAYAAVDAAAYAAADAAAYAARKEKWAEIEKLLHKYI